MSRTGQAVNLAWSSSADAEADGKDTGQERKHGCLQTNGSMHRRNGKGRREEGMLGGVLFNLLLLTLPRDGLASDHRGYITATCKKCGRMVTWRRMGYRTYLLSKGGWIV